MNTAIKPITPEREQELVAKLVDFLSSRYDAGNLYDILRHGLGMEHSDIPDDRYKRRDVRYYPECGMIEFSTFSSGFGSETVYEGFYYSDEDVPCGFQGTSMGFQFDGSGWSWHESDGDNFEYTEKILGKWYWYRMHF